MRCIALEDENHLNTFLCACRWIWMYVWVITACHGTGVGISLFWKGQRMSIDHNSPGVRCGIQSMCDTKCATNDSTQDAKLEWFPHKKKQPSPSKQVGAMHALVLTSAWCWWHAGWLCGDLEALVTCHSTEKVSPNHGHGQNTYSDQIKM